MCEKSQLILPYQASTKPQHIDHSLQTHILKIITPMSVIRKNVNNNNTQEPNTVKDSGGWIYQVILNAILFYKKEKILV